MISSLILLEDTLASFDKRVKLPESADLNDIMAKYENGVLTLVIHKKPEFVNQKKNIVIE